MKTKFTLLFLFSIAITFSQKEVIKKDTIILNEVLVTATRASKNAPFTQTKITKKDLEKTNLGQDIPGLLQGLTNVVTTSDAGAGVGYAGIRVRGSDATRINVTINGIPLNDSESQTVFWVNMPDFVSSVSSIQLQRGVGTSTNGASAFGASLSLATDNLQTDSFAEIDNSYGSFNTHKHSLKLGTGLLNKYFNFTARVSNIQSDGYIDRASSNLKSLYLEANYTGEKSSLKVIAFGGHEITYQAWYGIDKETLQNNRTYNPAGEFEDENGITQFYDKQEDNYKQDHYQLHFNHYFNANWQLNMALHYTYGRGYYEQYKEDEAFDEYGFVPVNSNGNLIESTDLVRRKWLKNDFYGTTFSVVNKTEKAKLIIGGALNKYEGTHFGKVIWAAIGSTNNTNRYYDNLGVKTDFNIFTKLDYKLNERIQLFGDLQYRNINYSVSGIDEGPIPIKIKDNFNFFNPKAGITYTLNTKSNVYTSFAIANKEPKRADYESDSKPTSEKLNNLELGWRFKNKKASINANVYYMNYENQLVLTGALNDVGTPIASNIGKSYRLGLEIDYNYDLITNKLLLQQNFSFSRNKNKNKFAQIDGNLKDFGDSNLSFSPEMVMSSLISYLPFKNFTIALQSKYVGEQFMSNINHQESKLEAYFVNHLQLQYRIKPNKIIKEIVVKTVVNNLFNQQYESNGYFYSYEDTWSNPGNTTTIFGSGYYPQAGIHFLSGVTLKF